MLAILFYFRIIKFIEKKLATFICSDKFIMNIDLTIKYYILYFLYLIKIRSLILFWNGEYITVLWNTDAGVWIAADCWSKVRYPYFVFL